MGIVLKQSFQNLITTYLGFGLGAINTLYLYVNFMSDTYYGLVSFILSTAFILVPFMAFGVNNTLVKFYTSFKNEAQDNFLLWMLLFPLVIIIPLTLLTFVACTSIAEFLSSKNEIVSGYVWYIFIIAVASAYFEVFFSWAKVQLKSTLGNFLKEVFHRVCVMILLIFLALELISINIFIKSLVLVYVLRMLIMVFYALRLRSPKLSSFDVLKNFTPILKYATLIIIAGSVATLLLDLDKFMIGKYVLIEQVAYYSVAIYIATVIGVPARSMSQITYPMVAQMLNERRQLEMKDLYQKSSLTLLVISGLLFLLIVCNIKSLYLLIDSAYAVGLYVVLIISASKLLDNCLGVNNAIVFYSDYYRIVLVIGIIAVFAAVILNLVFIPLYGINGAAVATFIATVGYSTAKLIVVFQKFRMQPFTGSSAIAFGVIVIFFAVFYFWDFGWHPIIAIAGKSLLLGLVYVWVVFKLNISTDVTASIKKVLARF